MESIQIEVRHRASAQEDVTARHAALLQYLKHLSAQWSVLPPSEPLDLDFSDGLSVDASLEFSPVSGLEGYASYVYRSPKYLRDEAEFDDRLEVGADRTQWSMRDVGKLLEVYALAFDAYRGCVLTDPGFAASEWEQICALAQETGKDEDGRDTICRIWPAAFYDDELCRRAFSMSAGDVMERLYDHVEEVRLIGTGVLIVSSYELLRGSDVVANDLRVRKLLGIEPRLKAQE